MVKKHFNKFINWSSVRPQSSPIGTVPLTICYIFLNIIFLEFQFHIFSLCCVFWAFMAPMNHEHFVSVEISFTFLVAIVDGTAKNINN